MLWDIMNDPWIPKKTYHEKKKHQKKKIKTWQFCVCDLFGMVKKWPFINGCWWPTQRLGIKSGHGLFESPGVAAFLPGSTAIAGERKGGQNHPKSHWRHFQQGRWTEMGKENVTSDARQIFFPAKKKVCCWDLPSHPLTVNTRMTLHFLKVWESQPKPSICYCYWSWGGKFQCIVNSCCFFLTIWLTWHSCNDWWNITFNRQVSLLSFGGHQSWFLERCVALIMIDKAMQAPLFKGTLWKLNNDGNAQANGSKPACWGGAVGIYMFSKCSNNT